VLHGLQASDSKKVAHLFDPKDAYRTKGSASTKKNLMAGTNHPAGVVTHFFLPTGAALDSVVLSFSDASGKLLASFSNKAKEKEDKMTVKDGGNTFVWDSRGAGAKKLPGMILWWANLEGPKAVPGDYKVSMSVNGAAVATHDFKIMADPRAESSIADMQAQYSFITAVNTKVQEVHDAIENIRAVNGKLDAFVSMYKTDAALEDLVAKAKALKEGLSTVEKALYQTQNRSGQDPLNFPIRLNNKLGHLNSLVGLDDFAPTAQDQAVRAELTAAIDVQLAAYTTLVGADLEAFNKAFNEKGLPFLKVEASK
jgi:hypothetical protein